MEFIKMEALKKKPHIVVAGSINFDFVAAADRLPRKGETVIGNRFGMYAGGKGANQAVQAARLGADVQLIGRIGNDFTGDRLLSALQESGVRTEFIKKDSEVPTSACCIHVDANGDNAIITSQGANMAVTVEDIEAAKDAILSADLLICQLEIAMQAVEYALNIASAHGIRTILNPAPARSIPAGLFQMAGILTPNETEAEFFSGVSADENDFEKCASDTADKLLGMGAGLIVMTLGENGAYIAGSNRRKHVKGFKIKAVDATAAGDAFNGALAVALAEGRDIEDAVVFANGAGALAASKAGAQASLCVRSELDEFLRSWVKHF